MFLQIFLQRTMCMDRRKKIHSTPSKTAASALWPMYKNLIFSVNILRFKLCDGFHIQFFADGFTNLYVKNRNVRVIM